MTEDFYDLLDIPPDASQDEIKEAYREKVRVYHPDVNDDDRARAQFTAVKKAHEILGDPVERQAYDRLGHKDYVAKRTSGIPSPDVWSSSDSNSGSSGGTGSSGSSTGTSSAGSGSSSRSSGGSGSRSGSRSGSTTSSRSSGTTASASASATSSSSSSSSSASAAGSTGSTSKTASRTRSSTGRSTSAGTNAGSATGTDAETGSGPESASESESGPTASSSRSQSRSASTGAAASSTASGATSGSGAAATDGTTTRGGGAAGHRTGTGTGAGTARETGSTGDASGRSRLADNPLVRWWRRQNFALPLIWLSVLLYAVGLGHFALENERALAGLAAELAALGPDPEGVWTLLASGRHGLETPAAFVNRVQLVAPPIDPLAWDAALAGVVAAAFAIVLAIRLGWREDTWRPLTIDETILIALALGFSTSMVGGPLLAGAVLMPVLFGVVVRHTRRSPGWQPSYLYVVPVLAPIAGIGAGLVGYGGLPAELLGFVALPLAGALGLPLRATIRKRFGR